MVQTALVGVDWGTSNVRGFRYTAGGDVVERRSLGAGLRQVEAGAWAATFQSHFGDWLQESPDVPVLLCGMVGSRQGWYETPYVECPMHVDELAHHLHRIPGTCQWIVPGLSTIDNDDVPDVMRGEETQLAGVADRQSESLMVCLPGTHTKWVQTGAGRIESFRTFMTGEMFDVLSNHSLLGRMASPGEFDDLAFLQGLQRVKESSRLLHDLFSVRTLRLFDRLASTSVAAYLSGLLIGHEVSGVVDRIPADSTVTVVGSSKLAPHYAAALQRWSRDVHFIDGETAAAIGLWRIASHAKLVQTPA